MDIKNIVKRIFVSFFVLSIIALTATANTQPVASGSLVMEAKPETYTLDPKHTYVEWVINHLGFSNQSGKWMTQGTLVLDAANPTNSKVTVTIPLAEMVTGIPDLEKHLKSKLFFDVANYPIATFVSDKVELDATSNKKALVHGQLTLRGVTRPITLVVELNKASVNPISNKDSVGFSAATKIKRSDFGMDAMIPVLGDEVSLRIEAEAYKGC